MKYKIPVIWSLKGFVEIEGESPEDAYHKAIEYEEVSGGFPLPKDGEFLDGSFEFDCQEDGVAFYNS